MKVDIKGLGLKEQVLVAALECSEGSCQKEFTFEDLLVSAWKKDKQAWGLRGYEQDHPDGEKMHREVDSRGGANKGIVALGFLEKVQPRIYRLTTSGLAAASNLLPSDAISREKADRQLEQAVKQIIEHPVFRDWLKDSTRPKYFREAGHFWGIAPGTPPKTVFERVSAVERTLSSALKALDERGVSEFIEQRGKVLFERKDIERCLEFQRVLTERFKRDLALLAPGFGI